MICIFGVNKMQMRNYLNKITLIWGLLASNIAFTQYLSNAENLKTFVQKLKENKEITQILFLGDSHTQADHLTDYLRNKFQTKYGNAGRGLVFPYAVANSNGAEDFTSVSNQTWENFRLVYEQDIFEQMGASGFVIGNDKDSFLEIRFKNPQDYFNKVVIFNDAKMENETFHLYASSQSLKDFISKKSERISYQIQEGETYPELASKFYTITTKLTQLNGIAIQTPKAGQWMKADKININYNPAFENHLNLISENIFNENRTEIDFSAPQSYLLFRTNASKGNVFYGFQFLNDKKNGVIFNTVGVNGATYSDFLKYPLQTQHLKSIKPDILIVALGTNESLSHISKEEFQNKVRRMIETWQEKSLPILLISPTDNKLKSQKVKEIATWTREISMEKNVAFLDLHTAMGGVGYFRKALQRKEANADGVHFLKSGYEKQAEIIWREMEKLICQ
ncbi:MAG: GDSL-type esterase/lipase family protein [Flavobacteriaceae bacterium]|nr:GDSL-type esterase/lipase family protein [Flavobacteriaceae bacterium]